MRCAPLPGLLVGGSFFGGDTGQGLEDSDGRLIRARTTLYECTIVGFSWHIIAELPELHHPLVLDAKLGIIDTMSGAAKPEFGQRKVSEATPKP